MSLQGPRSKKLIALYPTSTVSCTKPLTKLLSLLIRTCSGASLSPLRERVPVLRAPLLLPHHRPRQHARRPCSAQVYMCVTRPEFEIPANLAQLEKSVN